MPSCATTAPRPEAARSWRTNGSMNEAGRCWVTRIGTLTRGVSEPSSWPSAWIPPVEAPIASRCGATLAAGRSGCAGSADLTPRALGDPPEQADLAQQRGAVFLVELARARLGERVGGAERERRERVLGAAHGQRRDHQDARRRGQLEHLRDRVEPAHAGHVEIEQDHVGRGLQQRREGALGAVFGGGEREVGSPRRSGGRKPREPSENRRPPGPAPDRPPGRSFREPRSEARHPSFLVPQAAPMSCSFICKVS